jgi:hypothetical protein
MNRIAKLAILAFVACHVLPGQEKAATANPSVVRTLGQEVFLVKHRDPAEIVKIINFLGSGSKDAMMEANTIGSDIKAITVRDFPENVAAIKAAIEKLDVPLPEYAPIEVTMNVIWASNKEIKDMAGAPAVSHLSDVIDEISKIFKYKYFKEAAVITHTTKDNSASGKTVFGIPGEKHSLGYLPVFTWEMTADHSNRCAECIVSACFTVSYGGFNYNSAMQIKDAYVNLKNNEKVLLGTTTIGDLAMIVVVSAKEVSSF